MLSKRSKYAIHALVHLARTTDRTPVQTATIVEGERIPRKFLEAILLELKIAGIVGSRKGPGGGYYLKKKAD